MQVIALVGTLALAADPLVATGPSDAAVRQAAAGAGRPESSFTPVAWADLVAGPVALVGAGEWTGCVGPRATAAQLTLAVSGAEGALGYGDLEKARAELHEADRLAPCLGEDPPAALLARWHLARGADGDAASLALARVLQPAIQWSPSWPPEGAQALAALGPAPAVPVTVHSWDAAIRIDGGAPTGTLAPGVHLVQAGAVTGLLTVADEPLEVVLTPTFPPVGPGDLGDPAIREDTSALLLAKYGAGTRVFLADGDEAWAATAGRTDWTALRKVRHSPLIPVGIAIGAPALVATGIATALAQGARSQVSAAAADMTAATTTPDFMQAKTRYDEQASRFHTWTWVAMGGAAASTLGAGLLGVGLAHGEIEVRTAIYPGGAGIDLVVTR